MRAICDTPDVPHGGFPVRRLALPLSLLLVLFLLAPAATAASLRVAVVNVEYVVMNSKKGKAAKRKLKKTFERKQKALDKRQKDLLEQKKALENPSAMQNPEARKRKAQEFQQAVVKLQEDAMKNQQELGKQEMELMQPILQDLEKVLAQVADAEKYDFVLNKSQQGVLFAKDKHDITQKVLRLLDKE